MNKNNNISRAIGETMIVTIAPKPANEVEIELTKEEKDDLTTLLNHLAASKISMEGDDQVVMKDESPMKKKRGRPVGSTSMKLKMPK